MNAFPNVYIPTKLEYVPTSTKIRIFRVLETASGEVTLVVFGRGLRYRINIPAEALVLPEGVSINEEGHFLYEGKRVSLWDEVQEVTPRIIHGKLPIHTSAPEIEITL